MHDVDVDWNIPQTPAGRRGTLERFMGPGKTREESLVEMVGGVVAFAAILWLAWGDEQVQAWTALQIVLGIVLALDLVGGVLTNATNSAKRWYHRPGSGRRRARMLFISAHILHLVVVAFVLLPDDTTWFATHLALLAFGTLVIELAALEVKRPLAACAVLVAVVVGQAVAPLEGILVLVPVVFYMKLLMGHLVPEAPLVRRAVGTHQMAPQR